ncbi:MAG: TetR/AcrR family transcriptional regulator [Hyphomicrobium sp.]|uniref:TetR/AcrR family transcriptional regulator n=1 Tax=Hyphomicrobium sp. TaxID=82 RepID=UPI0013223CA6|nr:TetR/AcrR family transcriptional regulator [Hyphomicrobium sp.]KAB2943644.1 MAG: TetR/AcrR family transcriptional regulator [Hyphomicrobium sp.]MBZ0210657.1 TetR/AcrR family transcriptional regulator [Hyphomicrobium sp.]MCZ7594975.1 TetR/AcrR family transcriptional regulator [Hyphomicrobium sp.]
MAKTATKALPARERILETALRLFYAHGTRVVGVDRIIAESGVAKMSFYNHFPSKADLVAAFLEERHMRWMAWFRARLEARHAKRGNNLAAIADVLREWFAAPDFHGCAFINILAETERTSTRERAIARRHKDELLALLVERAKDDGAARPTETGRLALMIVEGAIVRAEMTGNGARAAADAKLLLASIAAAHSA